VRGCDPYFIDPEFRRLVWVHVVDRRREADYQGVIQGYYKMVAGIVQEFRTPTVIELVVEDLGSDVLQDSTILSTE
jgi:hypothetical protein